jgi:hypothetical protein
MFLATTDISATIDDESWVLSEIREYTYDNDLSFLFRYTGDYLVEREFSVKKIKKGDKNTLTTGANRVFNTLLNLSTLSVLWRKENFWPTRGEQLPKPSTLWPLLDGCLKPRKGMVYILAKHFARLDLDLDLSFLTPFEFALCCYDIYKYCDGRLLHSPFIKKHMDLSPLHREANLSLDELQALNKLLDSKSKNNEKNTKLIDFLHGVHKDFHAEYVVKYCERNQEEVERIVRALFPNVNLKFAGPKSAHRITEKYNEYSADYLKPGVHVYRKFKDLFRASISYDDFMNGQTTSLPLSSFNPPKGDYRVGYVILNIDTLNVELKVVKSIEAETQSHDWYELERSNSLENLQDFIRRRIQTSAQKACRY